MAEYRIYKLAKDGHIVGPPIIAKCIDDDAALIVAHQYVDGLATEIWIDNRRVAFIPADEE